MRSSIIILLLSLHFGLWAFQPPQEIQISEQELATQVRNRQSYLSLLPVDITRVVNQYTHPNIANEIVRIRKRYLTDPNPENMLKFLNDKDFNQKIIDDLAHKTDESNRKVSLAIMLNSPASFEIASEDKIFEKSQAIPNFRIFTYVFADYISSAIIDCEQVLEYADFYKNNIRLFKTRLLKEYQEKNQETVLQESMQKILERLEYESITDIDNLMRLKLKQLTKERGWTCAIQ